MKNVKLLGHNCIKIEGQKTIYFDPFKVEENYNDADVIFITHSHYDHFSPEDIEKVKNSQTQIVVTVDLQDKVLELGFNQSKILAVMPNEKYSIYIKDEW